MYKKINKKSFVSILTILVILICFVFSLPFTGKVSAASLGLAEIYSTNHPSIVTQGWTLPAFNTTWWKANRVSELNIMGYSAYEYTNIPAGPKTDPSVLRTLSNDVVFTVFGHATPGGIWCVNNSNVGTRISANALSGYNWNYSLAANFDNTAAKLNAMKFGYYAGCRTALSDATLGNLLLKTKLLGAKIIVGHNELMYDQHAAYFSYTTFYYGRTTNNTIISNLGSAKAATLNYFANNPQVNASMNYTVEGTLTNIQNTKFK